MSNGQPPVGLVLGSALPPEDIRGVARRGEELGFAELWLAEDYFFTGGISGATAALAETSSIPVGLGIVSAMVRNPAVLAMEISTLSRMYPGRLLPGIGLGLPMWIEQMGLRPRSDLTAMRECLTSVRRLLDGEEVDGTGRSFEFHNVKLTYPATERVPLYMGVIGPKMLRLSGAVADGTVVSVLAGTEYLRWARERIAEGMADAGRSEHHRVTTFALFSVDADGQKARDLVKGLVAFYAWAMSTNALMTVYGISDELTRMSEAGGHEEVARQMPDRWIDDLVVAGTPEQCAHQIRALLDAGADSVALFPAPPDRATELIELASREVLPRV
jgi:alkanesulfonate monooxygenase SsuD/methylene tetrahydromethanopterin reductase-like flavin-dependent oxidoreductase (luciferase family)